MSFNIISVGGSGNLPTTNELPIDMHGKMLKSFAGLTPLTVILGRLAEDKAHQFRIDWLEEAVMPVTVTVAISETSVGTSITLIEHADSLVAGTLLFNSRTFDIRRVTSNASQVLTVTIDEGGTTSSVWLANDPIDVLLTDVPEDDDDVYRTASAQDTNVFNYIQITRLQFAMTRTANASDTHFGGPGSKREQLKTQKFREYRMKFENQLYFGGRQLSGTAPASQYQMGGLTHFLRNGTLYKDFGGIFTESGLDSMLLSYKEQNPDATKLGFFCSLAIKEKISQFGKGKVRLSPNSKSYGMRINEYIGPIDIDIVPLPLLSNKNTRGWGFLLDLERIRLKYLERVTFHPDAKGAGASEIIYDTYRGSVSMLLGNEDRHLMCVGATL